MKLHVNVAAGDRQVNEVVEGADAVSVVAAMQKRVAQEVPFFIRPMVTSKTPLQFAQEVTKLYNGKMKKNEPLPQSCEEFLELGIRNGFATVVEP